VEKLNTIDVVGNMAEVAAGDPNLIHLRALNLPPQEKMLVISTGGIVQLGEVMARGYLENQ